MYYCYILFNNYIRPASKATKEEIPPSSGNNYNVHWYDADYYDYYLFYLFYIFK